MAHGKTLELQKMSRVFNYAEAARVADRPKVERDRSLNGKDRRLARKAAQRDAKLLASINQFRAARKAGN